VTFNPTSKSEEGTPWVGELTINTAQNEYGTTRITLRGVSYADDIGKKKKKKKKKKKRRAGTVVVVQWWW